MNVKINNPLMVSYSVKRVSILRMSWALLIICKNTFICLVIKPRVYRVGVNVPF